MIPEPNKSVSCPCCQVEIQYHDSHEYFIRDEKYLDCPYCGEQICVFSKFYSQVGVAMVILLFMLGVIYLSC